MKNKSCLCLNRKAVFICLLLFSFLFCSINLTAQISDTFKEKGFSLTFISQDKSLDPALKKRMIETFYNVYPKLVKEFNKKALKEVVFLVDTSYQGVAATSDGKVTFSSRWLKLHPEDIDVVTHEVMHIVQDYGNTNGPGWLTEGIADYVRYKFGVDNEGANWSLPDYKEGQSYKNSYRITAKFLDWLEAGDHKGMVKNMDKHLRDHTYSDELWRQYTGRTLDELWSKYAESQS